MTTDPHLKAKMDPPNTIKILELDVVTIHVSEGNKGDDTIPLVRVYRLTHSDLKALRALQHLRMFLNGV